MHVLIERNARLEAQVKAAQLETHNARLEARIRELEAWSQGGEARNQELEAWSQQLEARSQELETWSQGVEAREQELEQEVESLKMDQRLSAEPLGGQTVQAAMSTGSAEFALRAEIFQLQSAAKKAQRDKGAMLKALSRMCRSMESHLGDLPQDLIAAMEDMDRQWVSEAEVEEHDPREEGSPDVSVTETDERDPEANVEEHEPQEEGSPDVSVTKTDESGKPSATSPPKWQGNGQTRLQANNANMATVTNTPSDLVEVFGQPMGSQDEPNESLDAGKDRIDIGEEEGPSAHKRGTRELSSDIEEEVEETDQNRSHSPASSPPSYTSVSHQPDSTSLAAETEVAFCGYSLGESFLWPPRMRCAFMMKSDDGSTGPIGDPFQPMNGWAIHLEVDAGRHGRPNISLQFSINNGKKDAPVSRKRDQRTEFAITWRTGIVNDQRPMIETFEAGLLRRPDVSQQELTLLTTFTFTFKSNSIEKPELSATTRKPWKGLPKDVQHCLDVLFFQDEPRWIRLWFCVSSDPELAMNSWIKALQQAVNLS